MNGVIHIYDIKAGCLVRDLTVHNCQIRGIEWTSLHSMITHACESLNGSQGKSELAFINIKSGTLSTLNNNIIWIKISARYQFYFEMGEVKSPPPQCHRPHTLIFEFSGQWTHWPTAVSAGLLESCWFRHFSMVVVRPISTVVQRVIHTFTTNSEIASYTTLFWWLMSCVTWKMEYLWAFLTTFNEHFTLMLGSDACFGIMYFVPLCYIQIQAELDVSPLIYVATGFCRLI